MYKARISFAVVVIILLAASNGVSQSRTDVQAIMEAKKLIQLGSNKASGELFERAHNVLTPFVFQGDHQSLIAYYLGYIDYQMAVAVYRMDKEKAPACLDSAVLHFEKTIAIDENNAEAHALLGSCWAMQISFSPVSGIWRGPKSGSELTKAKTLSPENPRVALLCAIGTYHTPAMFGGGKEKGLEALKNAAELFNRWKSSDSLQPDWGGEQVYAWIGTAHLDKNETILARKAFEKSLEINPDYGWVKYVLLPKVQ
jgi:hypothetical protein